MALKGRFGNSTGRAYIECQVYLHQQSIAGNISFLVDTGANHTVMMPTDARKLFVDYSIFGAHTIARGIGGYSKEFLAPATLVFPIPGKRLFIYALDMHVSEETSWNQEIPSLLGRDILNNWAMYHSPIENRLEFTVLKADLVREVPPKDGNSG